MIGGKSHPFSRFVETLFFNGLLSGEKIVKERLFQLVIDSCWMGSGIRNKDSILSKRPARKSRKSGMSWNARDRRG